jgi:hypothetical protein
MERISPDLPRDAQDNAQLLVMTVNPIASKEAADAFCAFGRLPSF